MKDNVDKLLEEVCTYSWREKDILKSRTKLKRIENLIQAQWWLKMLEMSYVDALDSSKTEKCIILRDKYINDIKEVLQN